MGRGKSGAGASGGSGSGSLPAATNQVTPPTPQQVAKGDVLGMSAKVTATTKENIILEAECIGKIYLPNEFDKNEWTVYGEPDTTLVINRPNTVELTCADIVNRIPDVISAKPGFISTSEMNVVKYI